jgi:hypothetical protein
MLWNPSSYFPSTNPSQLVKEPDKLAGLLVQETHFQPNPKHPRNKTGFSFLYSSSHNFFH